MLMAEITGSADWRAFQDASGTWRAFDDGSETVDCADVRASSGTLVLPSDTTASRSSGSSPRSGAFPALAAAINALVRFDAVGTGTPTGAKIGGVNDGDRAWAMASVTGTDGVSTGSSLHSVDRRTHV